MSETTKHNKQIEFIFANSGKPPIVGMQVNEFSDLLALKYNYDGRNVWVKSLSQVYYLINGMDGSEAMHWTPLKSDFVVTAYENKPYNAGEFAIYNDVLYYSKVNNNTQTPLDSTRWVIVGGSNVLDEITITGIENGFGRFGNGDTIPQHQNMTERFIDAFRVATKIEFVKPTLKYSPLMQWFNLSQNNNINPNFLSVEYVNYELKLLKKLLTLGIDAESLLGVPTNKTISYYNFIKANYHDDNILPRLSIADTKKLIDANLIYLSLFTHPLLQDSISNLDKIKYNDLLEFVQFEETKFCNILINELNVNVVGITGTDLLNTVDYLINDGGTEVRRELIQFDANFNGTAYEITENIIDIQTDLNSLAPIAMFKIRVYYNAGTQNKVNNLGELENNDIPDGYVETLPITIATCMPIISPKNNPYKKSEFEFVEIFYHETFLNLLNTDLSFFEKVSDFNLPTIPFFGVNPFAKLIFPQKLIKQTFDFQIKMYNNYGGLFWLHVPNQLNTSTNFTTFDFVNLSAGTIIDYDTDFANILTKQENINIITYNSVDVDFDFNLIETTQLHTDLNNSTKIINLIVGYGDAIGDEYFDFVANIPNGII